jgi:hypothetical protein
MAAPEPAGPIEPRWLPLALCMGRFVVGGAALTAPGALARVMRVEAADDAAAVYVARLFGVRAVTMAGLVLATRGAERDRQVQAGVAVDAVDAVSAVLAGRSGSLRPSSAAAACAAALWEAALGVRWLMRRR